jgi:hypothetical protein
MGPQAKGAAGFQPVQELAIDTNDTSKRKFGKESLPD